jgi:hypothetical protein
VGESFCALEHQFLWSHQLKIFELSASARRMERVDEVETVATTVWCEGSKVSIELNAANSFSHWSREQITDWSHLFLSFSSSSSSALKSLSRLDHNQQSCRSSRESFTLSFEKIASPSFKGSHSCDNRSFQLLVQLSGIYWSAAACLFLFMLCLLNSVYMSSALVRGVELTNGLRALVPKESCWSSASYCTDDDYMYSPDTLLCMAGMGGARVARAVVGAAVLVLSILLLVLSQISNVCFTIFSFFATSNSNSTSRSFSSCLCLGACASGEGNGEGLLRRSQHGLGPHARGEPSPLSAWPRTTRER